LTVCPSDSTFVISLGPANPSLINIAKETLVFRRAGISPALRLLVPTFLLRNAPPWVTPSASTQLRTLSYHSICANTHEVLVFGTILNPDHLRRDVSGRVSCYAIFKGWLLLSQPPRCPRNITTLRVLSIDFGTLNGDLGCFPFDQWSLAPTV